MGVYSLQLLKKNGYVQLSDSVLTTKESESDLQFTSIIFKFTRQFTLKQNTYELASYYA